VRKEMIVNSADKCSKQELEDIVVMVRLELYNRDLPCGPKAIREKMDEAYHVLPLPSKTAISRILSRRCLTHQRTGWYGEDNPQPTPHGLQNKG
jgi:hypothetical protein